MATKKSSPKTAPPEPFYNHSTTLQEALQEAVTHTFRAKNSNTQGGVRIGLDNQTSNIPYIISTNNLKNPKLEYKTNKGGAYSSVKEKIMPVWKNIKAVEDWNKTQDKTVLPANATPEKIKAILQAIQPEQETKILFQQDEQLPIRLTQSIIFTGEKFVSITPLPNSGFYADMHDCTNQIIEHCTQNDTSIYEYNQLLIQNNSEYLVKRPTTVVFKVGGENTQNVGRLVFQALSKPIVQPFPKLNQELRVAQKIYHSGLTIKMPRALMNDYRKFRNTWEVDVDKKSTMRIREIEVDFVHKITKSIMNNLIVDANLVRDYYSHLDTTDFFPLTRDLFDSGIYDSSKRNSQWTALGAEHIGKKIAQHFTKRDNQQTRTFDFNLAAQNSIEQWIREVLISFCKEANYE